MSFNPIYKATPDTITEGQKSSGTVDSAGRLLVVAVNADGSALAGGVLPSGTDRSSSITTGGTAQALAAANTTRHGLKGQNISSADLWINEIGGTAAADTVASYRIIPGATFSVSTNRAISIVGATTGQKFSATEY